MDACAARARSAGARRRRLGTAVPRHLRRHADAVRVQRGGPEARGLGVHPRHRPVAAGQRQAPADAVEPRRRRRPGEPMFAGLGERPWFYFVHSLHGVPEDPSLVAATCDYGGPVNAAFRSGNVFATQFHPEKSAAAGLGLLGNFVTSAGGGRRDHDPVPVDRPARRQGRPARARATTTGRRSTATTPSTWPSSFCAQGATWIHVVDLDAARTGEARQPCRGRRRSSAPSPAGRTSRRAAECARSTTRRRWPTPASHGSSWGRRRWPIRRSSTTSRPIVPVAVGLDHRARRLAVHGWTETTRRDARRRARSLRRRRGVRHHRHRPATGCWAVPTSTGSPPPSPRPRCR